ncbi:unnamed protein product [Umbelopsis vinacea]
MRFHYLVVALFVTRASAACILGIGCDTTSSAGTTPPQSAVNTGSSQPTQIQGNNSSNNPGTSTPITAAPATGYTTVTADGGTGSIPAFPATTWNGPHIKTNTGSNSSPTDSNNGNGAGNAGNNNSSGNNKNAGGSTNTGTIAGGVVGGLAAIGAIGGLFFLSRRARRRRNNGDFTAKLTDQDFPSFPSNPSAAAAAAAAVGATTMPSGYNEPVRYDTARRFVPQQNPHSPPVAYHDVSPVQSEGFAPSYQAEYGHITEKPAEDTSHAGMWKPDVAESKPNV